MLDSSEAEKLASIQIHDVITYDDWRDESVRSAKVVGWSFQDGTNYCLVGERMRVPLHDIRSRRRTRGSDAGEVTF